MTRAQEIAEGLTEVRDRIARACERAGRPNDVTLIVVTKTFPASDVRILAELGVTDVGENRHQEGSEKAAACADLPLTWHMIGQLQRNKARAVVAWADVIQTVDREALAHAIGRAAVDDGLTQDVLVQVGLDEPARPDRGGCAPVDVPGLCVAVTGTPGLRLRGVMAVAPHPGDPDAAFARLAQVATRVRDVAPQAVIVSAGMSDDMEAAIAHGATHVRVGSAVLGRRPTLQ